MNDSDMIKEVYATRARWYDWLIRLFGYSATRKAILRKTFKEIPTPLNILDLGCGTGLATEILLECFPGANIIGLDISEAMLHLYKKKFPGVQVIIGDFNNEKSFSSFPDRKLVKIAHFDLIVSTGAVSEYGKENKAIHLVYKLLKPNGVFINIGVKRNVLGKFIAKLWSFEPISSEKFIGSCKTYGFQKIENIPLPWCLFPTSVMNYIIKARK